MDLLEKFKGCLLGVAIGDGIGRPFEGSDLVDPRLVEEVAEREGILRYTDDTEMTLNLAKSLVEKGGFDPEHAARTFTLNFDPTRGYGSNTFQILQAVREGGDWKRLAQESMGGEGSFGNGAAMRVAPLALVLEGEEMVQAVRECSRLTHAHPAGIEGAVLQARAIHLALHSEPGNFDPLSFLGELEKSVESQIFQEKLRGLRKLLSEAPLQSRIVQELGNGVEAFNSVPTALYCFLSHPLDFKGAVLTAVSLGGDADTIGSMTGALSGALLGVGAIPSSWLKKVEGREEIERLAPGLLLLFLKKELDGCEYCLSEEDLEIAKVNPEGGFSLENLMLVCKQCKKELSRGIKLVPRKRGKYRAVYRKSYRRSVNL